MQVKGHFGNLLKSLSVSMWVGCPKRYNGAAVIASAPGVCAAECLKYAFCGHQGGFKDVFGRTFVAGMAHNESIEVHVLGRGCGENR